MTKNECIRLYDQIVSAAREIETIRNNLMSVLGATSIDCFDEAIDRLADVTFQMIISTKFNGNPPSEWLAQQFIAKHLDSHMETFLSLIVADPSEDKINRLQIITDAVQSLC